MHIVIYQFNFKLNISESILFIFNSKSMQENVSTITRIKLLYDNTHLIRNRQYTPYSEYPAKTEFNNYFIIHMDCFIIHMG